MFQLDWEYYLISLMTSTLTHELFHSVLPNYQILGGFPDSLCYLLVILFCCGQGTFFVWSKCTWACWDLFSCQECSCTSVYGLCVFKYVSCCWAEYDSSASKVNGLLVHFRSSMFWSILSVPGATENWYFIIITDFYSVLLASLFLWEVLVFMRQGFTV